MDPAFLRLLIGPLLGVLVPTLDHAQGRIGERDGAVLLDDLVARAHQATSWTTAAQARFDDLAFDMDGIAGEHRALDLEFHAEKRVAGVLHRGLNEKAFSDAVGESTGGNATLNVGLLAQKLQV